MLLPMDWRPDDVSPCELILARLWSFTYDCYPVIVDVCSLVKLLFDFCVFSLRSAVKRSVGHSSKAEVHKAHWTPPGWRAVLFTLFATMVTMEEVKELEWKLPRCCLNIC